MALVDNNRHRGAEHFQRRRFNSTACRFLYEKNSKTLNQEVIAHATAATDEAQGELPSAVARFVQR